jgi:hypothetical protein
MSESREGVDSTPLLTENTFDVLASATVPRMFIKMASSNPALRASSTARATLT